MLPKQIFSDRHGTWAECLTILVAEEEGRIAEPFLRWQWSHGPQRTHAVWLRIVAPQKIDRHRRDGVVRATFANGMANVEGELQQSHILPREVRFSAVKAMRVPDPHGINFTLFV